MATELKRVAVAFAVAVGLLAGTGSVANATAGVHSVTYNRTAAVAYADRYSCNGFECRNPVWSSLGPDCTNFASQVLNAGGQPQFSLWVNGEVGWQAYNSQWIGVGSFLYEWRYTTPIAASFSEVSKTASYTPAQKGDIYAYDWGMGSGVSHLAIEAGYGGWASVYGTGTGDYIDQHAIDRYHAPFNYGYLHPDSNVNPATMHIYLLALKNSWTYASSS